MSQFLDSNLFYSLMAGLGTAVAAGFLGVFMIMKRMSLVSDALSHVALPGIALALIFNLNPFIGAFAFLLLAAVLISGLEKRTNLPIDAIVGVLFSAALAAGILLTPEPELLEALFGDLTKITPLEAWITIASSLAVVVITVLISRRIMFSIAAPDLWHASKLRVQLANFVFLLMLALVVALGIKFVGTLLMGTLTIIPAAAAKNVAKNLYSFGIISMAFAAVSVMLGVGAVYLWGVAAGPAVIIASAGIFLLTLVLGRKI
ncbi:MAG: metal ABC transporter permease [Candidatus Sungbacteria bacterium]|nr:metal ABC transporter permease [Candidatus Sungbacteria bacterium]